MPSSRNQKPPLYPITKETGMLNERHCILTTTATGLRFATYTFPEVIAFLKSDTTTRNPYLLGHTYDPRALSIDNPADLDAIKLDGFKQIKTA